MENKNIFVTGATGFIGEKLALKLVEKNKVFALVRPESIKKTANLKEKGVEIISGDILNSNSYSERLNGIDYVFHLAALCKLDAVKELLYKYNVLGTRRLFESCKDKNIKKIIYFSTAYVAGTKEKEFITEDEPLPELFKNWYEWSKAEGEKVALEFYKKYSLPMVIVRPAIVYGPKGTWGFRDALSLISQGKLWLLPGNGKNKIHLVHIDDVVNAAIYLAGLENNVGEIYNICDDIAYTCDKLSKMLCQGLGVNPPTGHLSRFLAKILTRTPFCKFIFGSIPPQLLDYFFYNQSYDNKKIKATNFMLRHPNPIEGLKSTINWYQKNVSI